ncbi:asparagine synthase-related protein [Pseudoalteromonas rubra]
MKQQALPTYFKGIHYLPAGNYLSIGLGDSQVHQHVWWSYPSLTEEEQLADTRSKEEIIEQYAQTLETAVSRRLMSDVDVGLFLSGGIDSVAIAAFASKQSQDLQTFSVFSQSTFQNGDAKSSFEAAQYLGLNNHQVNFSWHNNSFKASHWKELVWLLETPEIDAEHLYKYHLHRYARHHFPNLKVMLLGQGSDEFNGGYSHFYLEKFRPDLHESNYGWPALMETMHEIERHYLSSGKNSEISHYGNLVHRQFMAVSSNSQLSTHPWQTYTRMNRQNLQMYNLWHEDRTSSGNSIESRVPFLDHELVELCAKVPEKYYQDLFWDKRILREAMKPWLPERFYERPKVPFFMGQDQRYTQRMMYNLLIDDDYALLNEAFGDNRHSVISTKELNRLIDSIPEDPEYQGVEMLLKITNMGLLEKMARELPIPHKHVSDSYTILDSLNITDWSEQEHSALQETMSTRRTELSLDRSVALVDNVQLLSNSSQMYQSTCIFIAVNGQIEYELSEESEGDWMTVIQHIDGTRSLAQICTDLEIPVSKVRKHIEEAIDYDLLKFVE